MAKTEIRNTVSYRKLIDTFEKSPVSNNILLSLRENILLEDLIKIICVKFVGKDFNKSNNLITFNAGDKNIESLINECSNSGLFSERKVVVLKNIKKLLKDGKLALLDYLSRPNPDTCLVMLNSDDELDLSKIFLFDVKAGESVNTVQNRKIVEDKIKVYEIAEFTESDIIQWVKEKFDDYKISDSSVKYFLQFSNYSLDEILSEIEKLKTYCYFTKEITDDSINLCNGIAKDFNETDFIKAILEHKNDEALKIYSQISLKKDVEVFLIFLLNSAFITISKLFDPGVNKLQGFLLKKELKLWFPDQDKLLPFYRNYRNSIGQDKIKKAFESIYNTDKILKTSGGDKSTTMTVLINNICSL